MEKPATFEKQRVALDALAELLTEGCVWDIITALRGPDYMKDDITDNFISSIRLKELTTARIRAVIGVKRPVRGWTLESPLTPAEQEEREVLLTHASPHFHNHYFNAVEAVKAIYGYDLRGERKIPEA